MAETVGAGSIGGPGRLDVEGTHATVTFRRLLRHPIEHVWTAITDPRELERWFLVKVTREPTTGRLEMWHSTGVHATGRVLEWDPPRTYEYEWNVAPGPALRRAEDSVVRFELSVVPEGTLLVLTHRRLTRATAEVFSQGLPTYLARLSGRLDGTPMPLPAWLAPTRGWTSDEGGTPQPPPPGRGPRASPPLGE